MAWKVLSLLLYSPRSILSPIRGHMRTVAVCSCSHPQAIKLGILSQSPRKKSLCVNKDSHRKRVCLIEKHAKYQREHYLHSRFSWSAFFPSPFFHGHWPVADNWNKTIVKSPTSPTKICSPETAKWFYAYKFILFLSLEFWTINPPPTHCTCAYTNSSLLQIKSHIYRAKAFLTHRSCMLSLRQPLCLPWWCITDQGG